MPLTQKVSAGPPSFARRLLDLAVRQRERIIQGISLTDHRHAFAACALISSIVGIILIYVASAYLEIGSMGQMFSYRPDDIPGGLWPEMYPPPLGVHYFGDFLDTVRHSQVESPFTTPGMSPTGYPLFSLIVLAPFGLPSYRVALVLFLVITALVLLIPVWCSLRERPFAERLILLSPIVVCAPFLAVLDRGNIQGFVVGSALFGLLAYLRGNRTTAGVLFGLSAAMKPNCFGCCRPIDSAPKPPIEIPAMAVWAASFPMPYRFRASGRISATTRSAYGCAPSGQLTQYPRSPNGTIVTVGGITRAFCACASLR